MYGPRILKQIFAWHLFKSPQMVCDHDLCSTFKRLTSVCSINQRLEHTWWTNIATGDRQLATMRLGLTYLADQVAAI